MPSIKHIHRLRRHTYKATGNSVFFCTLADCSYKIETQFALGKETICNRCGKPFEMTTYAVRLAKPHCMNCHKSITGNKENEIVSTKILDSLLSESVERRTIPTRRSSELIIKDHSLDELRNKLETIPETNQVTYREIKLDDEDPHL